MNYEKTCEENPNQAKCWTDQYEDSSSAADPFEGYDVCPFADNTHACLGIGLYWNELACKCMYIDQCSKQCENGLILDPTEPCSCVDQQYVFGYIYNQGTSADMIAHAVEQGIKKY